jgi:nucleobase:cation symporter-1, NCS1 family
MERCIWNSGGSRSLEWWHCWPVRYISVSFFLGNTLTGFLDWTRYAKTPNASLFGQGVTCPLTIIITALCGLIVTSASAQIYGQYFWNPFELLLHIQSVSMTPAARAGTFFSGLAFLASQMALCIVLNAISTGMDMAALCPRWINIRRGCFILTIIAVAICPWNYVNNVTTFITVLSGWSIFLSGMTGILIFDYFLVRRCQLHKGDMYRGDKTSAYWYTAGFNWRAIVAWIMGVWPLLRTLNSISLLPQHIILTAGQLASSVEYKARVTATDGTMSMISAISSGS